MSVDSDALLAGEVGLAVCTTSEECVDSERVRVSVENPEDGVSGPDDDCSLFSETGGGGGMGGSGGEGRLMGTSTAELLDGDGV